MQDGNQNLHKDAPLRPDMYKKQMAGGQATWRGNDCIVKPDIGESACIL